MMDLFKRTSQAAHTFCHCDTSLPLISIYIISYNNVHFLYHAIKSVLEQTYGNIEITISDDASVGCTVEDAARMACLAAVDLVFEQNETADCELSYYPWRQTETNSSEELIAHQRAVADWDKDSYGTYQTQAVAMIPHLFPNVRSITFRRNPENLGTVKHLKCLKHTAAGKYIMFLAADDKLHDRAVIHDMVCHFEELPKDAYVLTSQCGMYDANLTNLLYYAVNEELKDKIVTSTPMQLFGELSDWCIIPAAGTIYKKKVFEIYGDLDDQYHLIEDWTYFLKLARGGAKVYFYDRLTYMHRDGGISHGNTVGGGLAYRYYLEDCILLTQQEILPYLDQVSPAQRKKALRRYRDTLITYIRSYHFCELSLFGKLWHLLRNGDYYGKRIIAKVCKFFNYRAKWFFAMATICALSSFLISVSPTNTFPLFDSIICWILEWIGLVLYFGTLLAEVFSFFTKRVLKRSIDPKF